MRPLHTTELVLTWLCLLPTDKTTSKWVKFGYLLLSVTAITINNSMLIASIVYFLKYPSTGEAIFFLVFEIIGVIPMIAMMLISYCLRHKIVLIFNKFSQIYAESKQFAKIFGPKKNWDRI